MRPDTADHPPMRISDRIRILIPVLAVSLAVSACSIFEDDKPAYVEKPVDELYNRGVDQMGDRKFADAALTFEEVERQHPYSVWATKAQIMAAYGYYKSNNYQEAVAALDRFIQLHPTHEDVGYAYYLKGLAYYEQISDVTRDQQMTTLALQSLKEVVTRFPDSKFARDAKFKMELTYDHLAGKEMEIGRYYHNQHQYLAAINRFRAVVDKYQTTTHVPEALHRLTEAYLALGLKDEARKTASVLGHNFPGSEWYMDSYEMLTGEQVRPQAAEEKAWYDRLKFW
ncbi:outer membrane protein assembly factor BamD [Thalassospiraceae bacterium LMO-SO8]|nr:outer membrane protein assembly factor BamD [Thalassospiraceae bacterium LMO-SO8]